MLRRRWLAVPLAGALALAAAAPAAAQPQPPVPGTGLTSAADPLAAARVAAEQAAEAYLGAQVNAGRLAKDAQSAAAAAAAAQAVADRAQQAADAAGNRFDAVASGAAARQVRSEDLAAAHRAAQQRLDAFAAAAYRRGGNAYELAVLTAALRADPAAYTYSKVLLERAGAYERSLVAAATSARSQASGDAARALTDRVAAHDEARRAAALAQTALDAAAQAQSRAAAATSAAAAATQAQAAALTAKARMQAQVSAVEQQLAASNPDPNSLQLQAVAARASAAALAGAGSVPAPTPQAATAVAAALRQVGVPYSWGGGTAQGPSLGFAQGANTVGFDCSGLTLYAYAQAGIRLDHYTGSQWNAGRKLPLSQAAPGDLVFVASNPADPATIHHMGLYIGGGQMVDAPHTGAVVRVEPITWPGLMSVVVRLV